MISLEPRSTQLCRSLVALALLISVLERTFLFAELHASTESQALLLACAASSAVIFSKWEDAGRMGCFVAWACLLRVGPVLIE